MFTLKSRWRRAVDRKHGVQRRDGPRRLRDHDDDDDDEYTVVKTQAMLIYVCIYVTYRGKSGLALGGTEYRLMPSACRLIVRQPL